MFSFAPQHTRLVAFPSPAPQDCIAFSDERTLSYSVGGEAIATAIYDCDLG